MNLNLDPWLLLPLALVLFLMAMPILSRRIKGKVDYITDGELNNMLAQAKAVVIIDIRSGKDFAQGHIEGAINILTSELEDKIKKGGPDFEDLKQQQIVIVCRSDLDSIGAAKLLENSGFKNVRVLKGGVLRWKRGHLPMVKNG